MTQPLQQSDLPENMTLPDEVSADIGEAAAVEALKKLAVSRDSISTWDVLSMALGFLGAVLTRVNAVAGDRAAVALQRGLIQGLQRPAHIKDGEVSFPDYEG